MQPGLSLPLGGQEQMPVGGTPHPKGAPESEGLFSGLLMASAQKLASVPEGTTGDNPASDQKADVSPETIVGPENAGVAVTPVAEAGKQDMAAPSADMGVEPANPGARKSVPSNLAKPMVAAVSPFADGEPAVMKPAVAVKAPVDGKGTVPNTVIPEQFGKSTPRVIATAQTVPLFAEKPGAVAVVETALTGVKATEDSHSSPGQVAVEVQAGLPEPGSGGLASHSNPVKAESGKLKVADVLDLEAKRLLQALKDSSGKKAAYTKPVVQPAKVGKTQPEAVPEPSISAAGNGDTPVADAEQEKTPPAAPKAVDAPSATAQQPTVVSGTPMAATQGISPHKAESVESPRQKADASLIHAGQIASAPEGHHDVARHAQAPHATRDQVPAVKDGAVAHDGGHVAAAKVHAPVFKQVVANLDLRTGESHVKIQLHPESLGKVEVALVGKGHTLEVRIVADSPQAAEALQTNLHELTDGLKAKASGFHHLDVRVEVREPVVIKQDGNQQERRDQQRGQERQDGRDERNSRQDGREEQGNRRGGQPGPEPWQRTHKEET